jgi:glycosyltransferase involved in cell wall biosynthesis
MPDLVVIMSVYKNDRLKFVTESVQSILQQTFTDFDYYIVFDGPVSPDIDNYVSSIKDSRISLFRREKNEGLAVVLNFLLTLILKKPEYSYVARMDADDVSMPSRFEKQRNFLSVNKEIAIVGCWYEEINESGKHLSDRRLPVNHEDLKKRYITGTPFAHPSVMFRRELIERAGFYPTDTVLMEDNALWGKALKSGLQFANIPEFLLKFRINKDFYKRRSGIKYGMSYIHYKYKGNRTMLSPFYSYFVSFGKGLLKMFPAFIVNFFYYLDRKHSE